MVFHLFIGWVFIIESGLLVAFGGDYRTVSSFIGLHKIVFGPFQLRTTQVIAFIVSVAISLIFYRVLMTTNFGRAVRATAQLPDVASLYCINVRRIQMLVFGLGFVLISLAGALLAPIMSFTPYTGFFLVLFALIILVLGGMGSFLGALVAGLIIGLAYGLSYFYIASNLAMLIPYGIFILVILFRPQGLFGVR